MEDLVIIDKIKKAIKNAETQIQETMMSGGVDNMEKYKYLFCLLYTSPSPRDGLLSRMPSSA